MGGAVEEAAPKATKRKAPVGRKKKATAAAAAAVETTGCEGGGKGGLGGGAGADQASQEGQDPGQENGGKGGRGGASFNRPDDAERERDEGTQGDGVRGGCDPRRLRRPVRGPFEGAGGCARVRPRLDRPGDGGPPP